MDVHGCTCLTSTSERATLPPVRSRMVLPDSAVHAQVRITTQAAHYTLVKASAAYRAVFAHLTEQSNVAFQASAHYFPDTAAGMTPHIIKRLQIFVVNSTLDEAAPVIAM